MSLPHQFLPIPPNLIQFGMVILIQDVLYLLFQIIV